MSPEDRFLKHFVPVQTFMMAIEPNNTNLPDSNPGPTDDGYIAVAVKSVPQDPFCCSGPNKDDLGTPLTKPTSLLDPNFRPRLG